MPSIIAKRAKQLVGCLLLLPIVIYLFSDLFFGITPNSLLSLFGKNCVGGVAAVLIYFVVPVIILYYLWPRVLKIRNKKPGAWLGRALVWLVGFAALNYLVMNCHVYSLLFFLNNIPAWVLSALWICCAMDDPPQAAPAAITNSVDNGTNNSAIAGV